MTAQTKPAVHVTARPVHNSSIAQILGIGEDMARRRFQRQGHLRKKGPSWLLEWREDVLVDGKLARAKFSQTIAPATGVGAVGKREAQRIAYEDILAKLDTVSQRPQSLITVNDFVKRYFEPDVVLNLKATGGRPHYEYLLGSHVLPAIGKLRLRDVTPERVQNMLRVKILGGAGARAYSSQTVSHIKKCIGAIFKHAKSRSMFSGELPTEGVRIPEVVNATRKSLAWEQAKDLIAALPAPYGDLAFLLASVGLRIGEACGLRWRRVNLSDQAIPIDAVLVPRQCLLVCETFSKGRWGSPKTPKSWRIIPIPDLVASRLARLKMRGNLVGPDDTVFVTTYGNPVDRCTTAEKFLKPAGRALGIPWVSWHSLRHSQATFAEHAGLTVSERQQVLGHASARITLHYTHAEVERVRAGLNEVAGKLETEAHSAVQ